MLLPSFQDSTERENYFKKHEKEFSVDRKMSFEIPTDILGEILLSLPPDEIFKTCRVNRRFASLCQNERFWKRVWLKHISPKLPSSPRSLKEQIQEIVRNVPRNVRARDLLITGAESGILFLVVRALQMGVSPFVMAEALSWAAERGHIHIEKQLVEHTANLN